MIGWAALVPLLIWIYLLSARGGFWRVRRQLARLTPDPRCRERVVAIVPARDEAAVIGAAVRSLLRQRYGGPLHVIVVDDGSTDGTAAQATATAGEAADSDRFKLLHGTPPPPGWTGKLWALEQGLQAAMALQPDYLLLTDADIEHGPDSLASLVSLAQVHGLELASYMVRLSTSHLAEKWLIPAFVFFFFKLYPPAWVASPGSGTAAAAGGCVLVRRAALERIGGMSGLRSQVIDDCALARAVKRSGGRLWLGLTRRAWSLRPYGSAADVGRMISRSAFSQLNHSYALLIVTLAGLFVIYLAPPLLLAAPSPVAVALGAGAWMLMSVAYLPMVRFYDLGFLWSLTLPAAAVFYAGATVHSALQYRHGRGGQWKGRAQDVRV